MTFRIAMLAAAMGGACATTRPVASSWNCGAMDRAVAESGAELYAAPDGNSNALEQFKDAQAVCADKEVQGFGFRRVTLADGRSGFVRESSLMNP
jgi:hypothetical protein